MCIWDTNYLIKTRDYVSLTVTAVCLSVAQGILFAPNDITLS